MTKKVHNFGPVLLLLVAALVWAPADAQEYPQAESFELESANGISLSLPSDQEGVGVYLFWASWCPYCRALMPHLQSLEDEFGEKLTVYALNFRDQQDPKSYITEHGFDFTLLPKG